MKKINESQNNIDILGYAVAFLTDHPDFINSLRKKTNSGCCVRILLGDPNGKCIKSRNLEEKNEGSIPSRIATSLSRLSVLMKEGKVEVRIHNTPLYCSIYRFDDNLLVSTHLYGIKGSSAPLFLYEKTKDDSLFNTYMKHFEDIWEQSKKC